MAATHGPTFEPLPDTAAWRHEGVRTGFETTFFRPEPSAYRIEGLATAVEEGTAWAVHYVLRVDEDWRTRFATVVSWTAGGSRRIVLESDGDGRWRVDQVADPRLDGCLDVDLEASAFTNALPVRRLGLAIGAHAEAPAAYVRATNVAVERLEQRYSRVDSRSAALAFEYQAPAFDVACLLRYDRAGLVIDYPELATRVR